jgi:hypothetical protein
MGLTINQENTKFVEANNDKTKEKHIITDNKNTEKIDEFQYPGSIVTCDNTTNVEINRRITMGNKCYYGLQNLLRSKLLTTDT